jgi:hypothetical protein
MAVLIALQPRQEKELAPLHPARQPQTHKAAVAAPHARPATKKEPSQWVVKQGGICVQIKDEVKRIRYKTLIECKSIAEVRTETSDFLFWKVVESLPEEDRETALHPRQWGTGYSTLVLSKYFGVSQVRIRDYITAYNRTVRNKTPHAH